MNRKPSNHATFRDVAREPDGFMPRYLGVLCSEFIPKGGDGKFAIRIKDPSMVILKIMIWFGKRMHSISNLVEFKSLGNGKTPISASYNGSHSGIFSKSRVINDSRTECCGNRAKGVPIIMPQ